MIKNGSQYIKTITLTKYKSHQIIKTHHKSWKNFNYFWCRFCELLYNVCDVNVSGTHRRDRSCWWARTPWTSRTTRRARSSRGCGEGRSQGTTAKNSVGWMRDEPPRKGSNGKKINKKLPDRALISEHGPQTSVVSNPIKHELNPAGFIIIPGFFPL